MGQIISNLFLWIFPKKNETQRNDHHHHHHHQQTKYQTFPSHNITIPKPNHPLLLSHNNKIENNEGNHDDNNNIIINSNNNNVPIIIPDDVVLVDMNISGYEEVAKKKVRRKKKQKKEANIKDGNNNNNNNNNNNGDVDDEQLMIRPCWENRGIEVVSRAGKIGPYTSEQRLLLVGEGDFSFAACLASAFGTSAVNIVATSLNSTNFLTKNYAMFGTNKAELESRGSTVLHGVDATTMMKHHILGSNNNMLLFDRIIFNFPHAGNFCSTELRLHQKLISGFLRNAKEMIKENGEIHITAKSNGCFLEWDIPKLGSDNGLNLLQQLKFKRSKYPGYNPKYGYGGDRNLDCNPSKTYKFGLPPK